jgi:hypothetical protein
MSPDAPKYFGGEFIIQLQCSFQIWFILRLPTPMCCLAKTKIFTCIEGQRVSDCLPVVNMKCVKHLDTPPSNFLLE